jgi:hypothetical protein
MSVGGRGHFQMPWPLASWGERATQSPPPLGAFLVGAGVDVPSDSTCSGSGLRLTNRPGGQLIWLARKGNRHDMWWVGRVFYYATRAATAALDSRRCCRQTGPPGREREELRAGGEGSCCTKWESALVDGEGENKCATDSQQRSIRPPSSQSLTAAAGREQQRRRLLCNCSALFCVAPDGPAPESPMALAKLNRISPLNAILAPLHEDHTILGSRWAGFFLWLISREHAPDTTPEAVNSVWQCSREATWVPR